WLINRTDSTAIEKFALLSQPVRAAASRDGSCLEVTESPNTLRFLHLAAHQDSDTVELPNGQAKFRDPDGEHVYYLSDGVVHVVSLTACRLVESIPVGSGTPFVGSDPDLAEDSQWFMQEFFGSGAHILDSDARLPLLSRSAIGDAATAEL